MSHLSSQPGELTYCYFALRKPPHVSPPAAGAVGLGLLHPLETQEAVSPSKVSQGIWKGSGLIPGDPASHPTLMGLPEVYPQDSQTPFFLLFLYPRLSVWLHGLYESS